MRTNAAYTHAAAPADVTGAPSVGAKLSARGLNPGRLGLRPAGLALGLVDLLLILVERRFDAGAVGDDLGPGVAHDPLNVAPVGHVRPGFGLLHRGVDRIEVGLLPVSHRAVGI